MDDVTFSSSGPYGETWRPNRYVYATITSGVVRPGRSLMRSMNALFRVFVFNLSLSSAVVAGLVTTLTVRAVPTRLLD